MSATARSPSALEYDQRLCPSPTTMLGHLTTEELNSTRGEPVPRSRDGSRLGNSSGPTDVTRRRTATKKGVLRGPTRSLASLTAVSVFVASLLMLTVPSGSAGAPSSSAVVGQSVALHPSGIHPSTASLSLSPSSGPVATTVGVSGAGMPTNASMSFAFGRTHVASVCATDSNGAYPGTTGTPCTFSVPTTTAGSHVVLALPADANSLVGTIPVGNQPYAYDMVLDSGANQLFVANYASNNVTVIDAASFATVASIPVGSGPYAVTYDPLTGEVFVANQASNNVSVISDLSDSVIATVAVGNTPYDAAFDPGSGDVYVATYSSNNVSVISGTTNTLVTSVRVGTGPVAVAYGPGSGEVFVANFASSNVSIINDTTNTIVGSAPVGGGPYWATWDPVRDQLFVPNIYTNNVSVVSGTSNSIVGTVAVGRNPGTAAYDPGAGEVFVANGGSNNVSVISDATDSVIGSVAVGSNPDALEYSPGSGLGEVFVANGGGDNVSIILDTTSQVLDTVVVGTSPTAVDYAASTNDVYVANYGSNNVSVIHSIAAFATASFTVTPTLYLSPASGPTGTSVSVRGTQFAANSTISFTFAGLSVPTNCSTDASGDFPGASGTACTFAVPSDPVGPQTVSASDGSNQANSSFTITPSLSLTPSAGPVGSLVVATGTSYAASSPISFRFDGASVASTCDSDSTGAFPGSSGTACSFTIPSAPYGPRIVTATDGVNSGSATYAVTASLSLNRSVGAVGSAVAAFGAGFAANSTIGFSVGGFVAPSTCSTDSTGTFPGTSTTACTFLVPSAPGGLDKVVASESGANTIVATVPVGLQPYPYTSVYDSARHEVFVASYGSNNVTVISDSTHRPVANIAVGSGPYAIVYDPLSNEVFVANQASSNVSVISDVSNSVVATIKVGSTPYHATFDPANGDVYVATYASSNVSVISGSTNTLLSAVRVGTGPVAVSYGPGSGEVFVANFNSANVSVINDTTNKVVANIPVGSGPYWATYDSGLDEMFVENIYTANVTVISASSNTIVATVPVGRNPGIAAYDPGAGEVFVANGGSGNVSVIADSSNTVVSTIDVGTGPVYALYEDNAGIGQVFVVDNGVDNVSVISDSSNTVVATLNVGTYPQAAVYDNGTGEVYVSNFGSNNVSVIRVQGSAAEALFQVTSSLVVGPPSGSVDAGQAVTVDATGFGASLQVTNLTVGGVFVRCTNATVGSCVGGVLVTSQSGSVVGTFSAPAVLTTGLYQVSVTDSAGNSATGTIEIYEDPIASAPVASSSSSDVGEPTVFSTVASLGYGSYSYAWHGLPQGCAGTQASIDCAPSSAGHFSITVTVTDGHGYSVTSSALSFTVFPDPVASTPVGSPLSTYVDAGQSVTFSTTASAGTGSYLRYTWSGLPTGCTGSNASVTCSGSALPAGLYSVSVSVIDSNNVTSSPSAGLGFAVDSDPAVQVPTATPASIDSGQTVTFTSLVTGGSGVYYYNWTGLPDGCRGTAGAAVACTPTITGTFNVQLLATDSNGYTSSSPVKELAVYPDPKATVSVDRGFLDVGQTVLLNASVENGSGGFVFDWVGLPFGCSSSSSSVTCVPTKAGDFSVTVKVTDSNGISSVSPPMRVAVAAELKSGISADVSAPTPGQVVNFASNTSGGTGPINYSWSFGDGSYGTGEFVGHSYSTLGQFEVVLWVNDSTGASVRASLNVSVVQPPATAPSASLGNNVTLYVVLGIAAAAVAIVALLLVRRRRVAARSQSESGSESHEPPSPDAEMATEAEGSLEPQASSVEESQD